MTLIIQYEITTYQLQASDSLQYIFFPENVKSLAFMVLNTDESILYQPIYGLHPILYIYELIIKADVVPNAPAIDYKSWFYVVQTYIRLSFAKYPSQFGFIFTSSHRHPSFILLIIRLECRIFNIQEEDSNISQLVIKEVNQLRDPTGLFHRLLAHCPYDFMFYFSRIINKGEF